MEPHCTSIWAINPGQCVKTMPEVRVECRSEYTYPQRPVALWFDQNRVEVAVVEDENRTPHGKLFRVRLTDGCRFELLYEELTDEWSVREIA